MHEELTKLYHMNLHEHIYLEGGYLSILSVPGGWIYTIYTDSGKDGGNSASSCFVPKM